eukprot:gene12717-17054_t
MLENDNNSSNPDPRRRLSQRNSVDRSNHRSSGSNRANSGTNRQDATLTNEDTSDILGLIETKSEKIQSKKASVSYTSQYEQVSTQDILAKFKRKTAVQTIKATVLPQLGVQNINDLIEKKVEKYSIELPKSGLLTRDEYLGPINLPSDFENINDLSIYRPPPGDSYNGDPFDSNIGTIRNMVYCRDKAVMQQYHEKNAGKGNKANWGLQFDSNFECGNLYKAESVTRRNAPLGSPEEYDLFIEQDSSVKQSGIIINEAKEIAEIPIVSSGWDGFWYFFRISNNRAKTYKFNICNFCDSDSKYQYGMKPLVLSEYEFKTNQIGWRRIGSQLSYTSNLDNNNKDFGPNSNYNNVTFTLSFQLTFSQPKDNIYVAYAPLYSYTQLQNLLYVITANPSTRLHLKLKTLCRTLAGNKCEMLEITENNEHQRPPDHVAFKGSVKNAMDIMNNAKSPRLTSATVPEPSSKDDEPVPAFMKKIQQNIEKAAAEFEKNRIKINLKPVILITARTCPGESISSWICEGIIKFLLGTNDVSSTLRKHFVFAIIPMVNPDGVINGFSRNDIFGHDLNTRFNHSSNFDVVDTRQNNIPHSKINPTVYHLNSLIKSYGDDRIKLYFDIRGDSIHEGIILRGTKVLPSLDPSLTPALSSNAKKDSLLIMDEKSSFDEPKLPSSLCLTLGKRTSLINLNSCLFVDSTPNPVKKSDENVSVAERSAWVSIGTRLNLKNSFSIEASIFKGVGHQYARRHLVPTDYSKFGCVLLIAISDLFQLKSAPSNITRILSNDQALTSMNARNSSFIQGSTDLHTKSEVDRDEMKFDYNMPIEDMVENIQLNESYIATLQSLWFTSNLHQKSTFFTSYDTDDHDDMDSKLYGMPKSDFITSVKRTIRYSDEVLRPIIINNINKTEEHPEDQSAEKDNKDNSSFVTNDLKKIQSTINSHKPIMNPNGVGSTFVLINTSHYNQTDNKPNSNKTTNEVGEHNNVINKHLKLKEKMPGATWKGDNMEISNAGDDRIFHVQLAKDLIPNALSGKALGLSKGIVSFNVNIEELRQSVMKSSEAENAKGGNVENNHNSTAEKEENNEKTERSKTSPRLSAINRKKSNLTLNNNNNESDDNAQHPNLSLNNDQAAFAGYPSANHLTMNGSEDDNSMKVRSPRRKPSSIRLSKTSEEIHALILGDDNPYRSISMDNTMENNEQKSVVVHQVYGSNGEVFDSATVIERSWDKLRPPALKITHSGDPSELNNNIASSATVNNNRANDNDDNNENNNSLLLSPRLLGSNDSIVTNVLPHIKYSDDYRPPLLRDKYYDKLRDIQPTSNLRDKGVVNRKERVSFHFSPTNNNHFHHMNNNAMSENEKKNNLMISFEMVQRKMLYEMGLDYDVAKENGWLLVDHHISNSHPLGLQLDYHFGEVNKAFPKRVAVYDDNLSTIYKNNGISFRKKGAGNIISKNDDVLLMKYNLEKYYRKIEEIIQFEEQNENARREISAQKLYSILSDIKVKNDEQQRRIHSANMILKSVTFLRHNDEEQILSSARGQLKRKLYTRAITVSQHSSRNSPRSARSAPGAYSSVAGNAKNHNNDKLDISNNGGNEDDNLEATDAASWDWMTSDNHVNDHDNGKASRHNVPCLNLSGLNYEAFQNKIKTKRISFKLKERDSINLKVGSSLEVDGNNGAAITLQSEAPSVGELLQLYITRDNLQSSDDYIHDANNYQSIIINVPRVLATPPVKQLEVFSENKSRNGLSRSNNGIKYIPSMRPKGKLLHAPTRLRTSSNKSRNNPTKSSTRDYSHRTGNNAKPQSPQTNYNEAEDLSANKYREIYETTISHGGFDPDKHSILLKVPSRTNVSNGNNQNKTKKLVRSFPFFDQLDDSLDDSDRLLQHPVKSIGISLSSSTASENNKKPPVIPQSPVMPKPTETSFSTKHRVFIK